MKFGISRLWPWLAAVLSGLLMTLCFAPFRAGGLSFVALVPLLCALWLNAPARRPCLRWFALGYVSAFVFFATTFYWLHELAPLFDAPALRALPLALALYLAFFPALWAMFTGWIAGRHFAEPEPGDKKPPLLLSTRNIALAVLVSAAWAATEWMRGLGPWGMTWNALGVALHHPKTLTLIQFAEFTGVTGVSFLLVMCNVIFLVTILRLLAEIGRTKLRPHFDFTFTVALFAIALVFGARTLMKGLPKKGTQLRICAVQPDIPQSWKLYGEHEDDIRERIKKLHSFAEPYQPQLVLWPEAIIPDGMLHSEKNKKFVHDLAATTPALLLGTDDPSRNHNSAAFIVNGEVRFYDKRHLVPFGEYLPWRPLLGWALGGLVQGDFAPGDGPAVFTLPNGVKISPLICFEDTDATMATESVRLGAQVLVNITNDGWFGKSAESEQHLINSAFRAVENRRPLVRCANNSMTASVNIFGYIDPISVPFSEGFVKTDLIIPEQQPLTFFTRHPLLFPTSCAALVLLVSIARMASSRHRQG